MILQPLQKQDFAIKNDMRADAANKGFTKKEIELLMTPEEKKGAKGILWGAAPPERQKLKSEFGYQSSPLLADLITVAEAQGTPLDGFVKALSANYNFFIMRCGVYIAPDGGEKFDALKFEIRYKYDRAATYAMLPGPETKKILGVGGNVDIGVDGKVAFGFPEVSLGAASVDVSVKTKLDAKFIVSFNYELKTQVVDSFGSGNPFCRWLMHKGDNLRNDVVFYSIIRTPKAVKGFDCEFRAYFKVSHPDWNNGDLYENPPITVAVSA
jgi:hypothetical protein